MQRPLCARHKKRYKTTHQAKFMEYHRVIHLCNRQKQSNKMQRYWVSPFEKQKNWSSPHILENINFQLKRKSLFYCEWRSVSKIHSKKSDILNNNKGNNEKGIPLISNFLQYPIIVMTARKNISKMIVRKWRKNLSIYNRCLSMVIFFQKGSNHSILTDYRYFYIFGRKFRLKFHLVRLLK